MTRLARDGVNTFSMNCAALDAAPAATSAAQAAASETFSETLIASAGEASAASVRPRASGAPGEPPPRSGDGGISAFGAGCFDDSADVPGHTELWFTLRGSFDARTGNVQFEKVYERPAPSGEVVRYVGRLHALNGPRELTGTWTNVAHGTEGTWSCQLVGDTRHASGGGMTNERSSARNTDGTTDPSTP